MNLIFHQQSLWLKVVILARLVYQIISGSFQSFYKPVWRTSYFYSWQEFLSFYSEGYRSAISTTYKRISKIDFADDSVLADLIRSLEFERPKIKPHFPMWDFA